MKYHTKDFGLLELSDDFMFAKVMRNQELCRELLELIMGIPIERIVYSKEQKTIDISMDARSVRLDVYVADQKHTVYDVEMQNGRKEHLPKRSRYYQGMIDLNLIEKGKSYRELNPSCIIFICTFDPFREGRHIYTFENRCLQENTLQLGDGTRKIFLNARGSLDDVSEDIKAFLNYLVDQRVETAFVDRLDHEVKRVRENKEWRREYMTLQMKLDEVYEEARKEGLEEGREKGWEEGLEKGWTEGRAEGMEQGLLKGETRMFQLIQKMMDNGETNFVSRLSDKEFLEKMYQKYDI